MVGTVYRGFKTQSEILYGRTHRSNVVPSAIPRAEVWVRVDDHEKVFAIADEDMERETAEKTSSVHFLRFQLTQEMLESAKQAGSISFGVDHQVYNFTLDPVGEACRKALAEDLT